MRRGTRWLGLTTLLLLLAAPGTARGGLLGRHIDILYVIPFVGGETARLGVADLLWLEPKDFTITAATYGATAGLRLGPLNAGVLFQHTSTYDPDNAPMSLNKFYGEIGFNASYGIVTVPVHFNLGYAYISNSDIKARGPGTKIGLAIDLYPLKMLSIGVGADLDLQLYIKDSRIAGAYGGTFCARLGIHL